MLRVPTDYYRKLKAVSTALLLFLFIPATNAPPPPFNRERLPVPSSQSKSIYHNSLGMGKPNSSPTRRQTRKFSGRFPKLIEKNQPIFGKKSEWSNPFVFSDKSCKWKQSALDISSCFITTCTTVPMDIFRSTHSRSCSCSRSRSRSSSSSILFVLNCWRFIFLFEVDPPVEKGKENQVHEVHAQSDVKRNLAVVALKITL